MSRPVVTCRDDLDVVLAARLMGEHQIRRLMVCNGEGRLIGVVSLGDIARDASEELAGQALGETVESR
jgi:IMP dehydrogenase